MRRLTKILATCLACSIMAGIIEGRTFAGESRFQRRRHLEPERLKAEEDTSKILTCSIWGGAHFKTFDGFIYSYFGKCPILLLQGSQDLVILMDHGKKCHGNDTKYCDTTIYFWFEDYNFQLTVDEQGKFVFTTAENEAVRNSSSVHFHISGTLMTILLDKLGVTFKSDIRKGTLDIEILTAKWKKTEGLCGLLKSSFNEKNNEYKDLLSFTKKWTSNETLENGTCDKVGFLEPPCEEDEGEIPPMVLQNTISMLETLSREVKDGCNEILQTTALFKRFQWDFCLWRDNLLQAEEMACLSLEIAMMECQKVFNSTLTIPEWRTEWFCRRSEDDTIKTLTPPPMVLAKKKILLKSIDDGEEGSGNRPNFDDSEDIEDVDDPEIESSSAPFTMTTEKIVEEIEQESDFEIEFSLDDTETTKIEPEVTSATSGTTFGATSGTTTVVTTTEKPSTTSIWTLTTAAFWDIASTLGATLQSKCPSENEEWVNCLPTISVTCKTMHLSLSITDPEDCESGCACKSGMVRDLVTGQCVTQESCPCYHAGKSYQEGHFMSESCKACECRRDKWVCNPKPCLGVCSCWGASHYQTFDGASFDLHGKSEFVMAEGVQSEIGSFSVSAKNEDCGSLTCLSKVILKVNNITAVTFTKEEPLNFLVKSTQGIEIREIGNLLTVEIPSMRLLVQWDRGSRVYVKLADMWQNKVGGMCGNFNQVKDDDVLETALDRWCVGDCSVAQPITNTCKSHPGREAWAKKKCEILNSDTFKTCRYVVPVEPFFQRCLHDTCGCDHGGDNDCLCTAIAAYAQECAQHGQPVAWRSQRLCPMQCEGESWHYNPCVDPCPLRTCKNPFKVDNMTDLCRADTCTEGCRLRSCPPEKLHVSLSEPRCVPKCTCTTPCLVLNGDLVYEGDLIHNDPCYQCRCFRQRQVCEGTPCVNCRSGWSPWISNEKPCRASRFGDVEPLQETPEKPLKHRFPCPSKMMRAIKCRVVGTNMTAMEAGQGVTCDLENGLQCQGSSNQPCLNYEIAVFCVCPNDKCSSMPVCAKDFDLQILEPALEDVCPRYKCVKNTGSTGNEEIITGTWVTDDEAKSKLAEEEALSVEALHQGETVIIRQEDVNVEQETVQTTLPPKHVEEIVGMNYEFVNSSICSIEEDLVQIFDGKSHQYDICHHVLAMRTSFDGHGWRIVAKRECAENSHCTTPAVIQISKHIIYLHPELTVTYDGRSMALDQGSELKEVKDLFRLRRTDEKLIFESTKLGFYISMDSTGHIKIEVAAKVVNEVEGLCNSEIGDGERERREAEEQWALPGTVNCYKRVRVEKNSPENNICDAIIITWPISQCGNAQFQHSLRKACAPNVKQCLKEGNTEAMCRCEAAFSIKNDCASVYPYLELSTWAEQNLCTQHVPTTTKPTEFMTAPHQPDSCMDRTCSDVQEFPTCPHRYHIIKVLDSHACCSRPICQTHEEPMTMPPYHDMTMPPHHDMTTPSPHVFTTPTPVEMTKPVDACAEVTCDVEFPECPEHHLIVKVQNPQSCCPRFMCEPKIRHHHEPPGFHHGLNVMLSSDELDDENGKQIRVQREHETQLTSHQTVREHQYKEMDSHNTVTETNQNEQVENYQKYEGLSSQNKETEENQHEDQMTRQQINHEEISTQNYAVEEILNNEMQETSNHEHEHQYEAVNSHNHTIDDTASSTEEHLYTKTGGYEQEDDQTEISLTERGDLVHATDEIKTSSHVMKVKERSEVSTCRIDGEHIETFEGRHVRAHVCNHVLARLQTHLHKWSIAVMRNCTENDECYNSVRATFGSNEIYFSQHDSVIFDGHMFTIDQAKTIGERSREFSITKLGKNVILEAIVEEFLIIIGEHNQLTIQVPSKNEHEIAGLCGLYRKNADDLTEETTSPRSMEELVNNWAVGDSLSTVCSKSTCAHHRKNKATEICNEVFTTESLTQCSHAIVYELHMASCMARMCGCLGRHGDDMSLCRCEAAQVFVTQCLNVQPELHLHSWRDKFDCPSKCSEGEIWHDCHLKRCEASCGGSGCQVLQDICLPGCFCAPGTVRHGKNCIPDNRCSDCKCIIWGDPHYISFDQARYDFNGECTYVASKDVTEDGNSTFQVLVTLHECLRYPGTTCTVGVAVQYGDHLLQVEADEALSQFEVLVDGQVVKSYPVQEEWVVAHNWPQNVLRITLPALSLNLVYTYSDYRLQVGLPSSLYAGQLQGLCGNCNGDKEDDFTTSLGTITNNINDFGSSWILKEIIPGWKTSKECIGQKFGALECAKLKPEDDFCLRLLDEEIFGMCHLLIDPAPFVSSCQSDVCHSNEGSSAATCRAMQTYAALCQQAGLCPRWRSKEFCPLSCPTGMEYQPCGSECPMTCDNLQNHADDDRCRAKVEGCFCRQGTVLKEGQCVPATQCHPCDGEGHYEGDKWNTDTCTECTCKARTNSGSASVICFQKTCPNSSEISLHDRYSLEEKRLDNECCPTYRRIGCKSNGVTFQIGEIWSERNGGHRPHDFTCILDEGGEALVMRLAHVCPQNSMMESSAFLIKFGSRWYHFPKLQRSWFDAKEYCTRNGLGLASIETAGEFESFKTGLLAQGFRSHSRIWLSGHLNDSDWMWSSTGQKLSFMPWASGQPDNNVAGHGQCLALWNRGGRNFEWHDFSCAAIHNFVCELNTL